MSGDELREPVRRPRKIARPRIPPGALRDLKDLLYQMYLEADTPSLDQIAEAAAGDDDLPGSPSRDTVRRILRDEHLTGQQADVVSVAIVLSRLIRADPGDAAERVRKAWLAAQSPGQANNSESVDDRGRAGLLRPIVELDDPFDLEVHPAVEASGSRVSGLALLPPYIRRPHDEQLAAVIAEAASGHSAVAVLIADSSAGKTRACWEAIRTPGALPESWRLWHPIDPGRPQALLAGLSEIGPHTVVWLNETQHYLLTEGSDVGEQAAAGLRELLRDPARGPILVLGTLWTSYNRILTAEPSPGQADPHAHARALISRAGIRVPEAFAGQALETLKTAAAGDPRLALAVEKAEDGRIAQFLAGAPELERRYRDAEPAPRALLQAAMDARRLGHGVAIPLGLLEIASPGYFADLEWDQLEDDWLESALAECAKPCHGARGPLTRIRPRSGRTTPQPVYRLADHLEQIGRSERALMPVPPELWNGLVDHAPAGDRETLGAAAASRGLYRYAMLLSIGADSAISVRATARMFRDAGRHDEALARYQRAADAGINSALLEAAAMLRDIGRDEEALAYFQRAADAGHPHALVEAARILWKAQRIDEAFDCYQRAADAGINSAPAEATRMLRQAGRSNEALAWLTTRAEAGDPLALRESARLLRGMGRDDEALICYQDAANEGDRSALAEMVRMLRETGRSDEALDWLTARAEAGDRLALAERARTLRKAGRSDEALTWLTTRAEAGDRSAMKERARMLRDIGRPLEALAGYQAVASAGDRSALAETARMLRKAGRDNEALIYYQRAANAGDRSALAEAVRMLRKAGRGEDALGWLTDRAEAGDRYALKEKTRLLQEAGRSDDALASFTAQAAAGDHLALLEAARMLRKARRTDEALMYCQRAADAGERLAVSEMARVLRNARRRDEAARLLRYGREPDGSIAEPWTTPELKASANHDSASPPHHGETAV